MKIDWSRDKIFEVRQYLISAEHKWDRQTFIKPTKERRIAIIHLLKEAIKEIQKIIDYLT